MATNPFTTQTDDLAKKYTVAPDLNTFDEAKSTAGRVASITSSGSPLMDLARTRATQTANARGLRNSSLAAGAGERAVIETATPIAAQDASLYQQAQLANQQAKNQASQFNANLGANLGIKGLELGETSRQFDTTAGLERDRLGENTRQFDATLKQRSEELAAQKDQFAAKLGLDTKALELNRDQLSQQDRQFLQNIEMQQKELAQQASQFEANLANQRTLAAMDAENRLKLMEAEAAYKNDIAGNENIAGAWATMMQGITQIQNNPEIESGAKATLIQNQVDAFKSFSSFWKKVSGGTVDVTDLLNFGQTTAAAPPAGTTTSPTPNNYIPGTAGDF